MSAKENLVNTFGTVMTVVIAIICVGFFPFYICRFNEGKYFKGGV